MKVKVKVEDKVKIIAGKDRGKEGKVIQVLPEDGTVVVEGCNKMFKHVRGQKRGEKGQRIEFSAPLSVNKVMFMCPKCSKPTRIGYREQDGKKRRICKKCKEIID